MSTPTPSHQGDTITAAHIGGNDSSFDSFIDSNLILDASSPAPSTPTKSHRDIQKLKISAPLMPTRLNEVSSLNSPTTSHFLHYPHASSSTVNTPTTSNPSNLHNLNFDFFDGHGNTTSASDHSSFKSDSDGNSTLVPSFGDDSNSSSSASSHVFSWNATNNTPSFYPIPLTHSFSRSVDDLGHGIGSHHAVQHHQRSLSLRDVAPPPFACDGFSTDSLTTLPFPLVKMEHDFTSQFTTSFTDDAPSPITEDQSSPSSSAVSSSLFENDSPRQDKKRRLASPSESMASTHSNKSSKSTLMARSSTGSTKKVTTGTNRRSRASTLISKSNNASAASPPATTGLGFSPASLIENTVVASSGSAAETMMQVDPGANQQPLDTASHTSQQATVPQGEITELTVTSHGSSGSSLIERDGSVAPKQNNKRPPPSASQITESGQPFPVIDTSAKHSSLFVPPDTSGLTKREARLVKNRAAAFLSRQRKREQFEELEIKCKSLCRLVWRFWEIVAGPNHEVSFLQKYSQTRILSIVLEEEVDEVREVLEMVVALKGGSVAPTEDGQMQGAISAGIPSANGKIVSSTAPEPKQKANQATGAVNNEMSEIVKLRAELEESKKRESALQAELVQERSSRMSESYNQEARKPFRGVKQEEALSLTISPKYQGDDVEIEEERGLTSGQTDDCSRRKMRGRGNARQGPSRTSERLQRQQSQMTLTSTNAAANGGQRKAAGAALMMVLFSFALFGLPSGQIPRVGGVTKVRRAEDFSVGKVLGAPLSGAAQYNQEEDEDMVDYDLTGTQAPSSHLSAKDLMPEMSDLLNLEANQDEVEALLGQQSPNRSFRDVLGNSHREDQDNSVDYQAFARDLGASLDWDVQRGFIVIGSDHDRDEEIKGNSANEDVSKEKAKGKDESDAPTKLTLFVPAPDLSSDVLEAEDRFYDAPLASSEAAPTKASTILGTEGEGGNAKGLTQAEATKAALRVLRNHRIAQEAAALATSRKLGNKKPFPSHRVGSPHRNKDVKEKENSSDKVNKSQGDDDQEDAAGDVKMNSEASEEQDYSREVMAASSTTDKIRGTDFYQLEFSLSGAKVRNVAELAKLLGVVRNKK